MKATGMEVNKTLKLWLWFQIAFLHIYITRTYRIGNVNVMTWFNVAAALPGSNLRVIADRRFEPSGTSNDNAPNIPVKIYIKQASAMHVQMHLWIFTFLC